MRHPDGLVLSNIRRRGIKGEIPRLAFFEWSAEVLDEDGNELPPDRVPDAVAADPRCSVPQPGDSGADRSIARRVGVPGA